MGELADQDRINSGAAYDAATTMDDHAVAPNAATVRRMVSQGRGNPEQIASVMRANPSLQREIVAFLQSTLGNGFVQAVVRLLSPQHDAPGAAPGAGEPTAGPTGPTPRSAAIPLGPVRVTASGLNVRGTPDTSSKDNVVGGLHHHAVVTAVGYDGDWLRIEYHGKPAYIFSDYVEPAVKHVHHAAGHEHKPQTHAHEPAEPAPAPAPIAHPPAPAPAPAPTPTAPTTARTAPTPTHTPTGHDSAHVPEASTPAGAEDAHAKHGEAKDGGHTEHQGSGFAKYGGGSVRDALTRLAEAGTLHLTGSQIALLDAVAQVETGGQIGCVQTYDDQIVSVGFKQVVLGHGSLEKIMEKAPAGFARHGLTLDMARTYNHPGWSRKPHQIAGCADEEQLRGEAWGMKFYAASMEPDVIAAMCELALGEAGKVEAAVQHGAAGIDHFSDLTAQAWLLETYNNRPGFMPKAIKRAVDAGAKSAANRDAFLDILAHAIVETYVVEEPLLHYHKAKKAQGDKLTPDKDAALLEEMKHKYEKVGRRKGSNIVTKISRHLVVPKLEHGDRPAPAHAPAAPVHAPVASTDHADHADPADHPVPAPVAHPTPVAMPPAPHPEASHTPVVADAPHAPAPAPVTHAPVPTPVATPKAPAPTEDHAQPVTVHAPPSTTNANNHVDTAADVFSAVYKAGAAGHTQYTQVYVSPGGLTSQTPDVFLFFHGHVAQYNIDPNQKQKSVTYQNGTDTRTRISGKDVAAEAMTHARGKNTVCILPQGVVGANQGGDHEGGYMKAIVAGLPSFMSSVLGQLATDLHTGPLTPGHLSIAGHSAGGYEGISQALSHAGELYDTISDVTLMDTGYGKPVHFQQTRDWMFQGKPGKNVRIIAQGGQLASEDHGYITVLGPQALQDACDARPGFSVQPLAWNNKPTKETRVMQHTRILKDGKPHAEVLVLKYWDESGDVHHNLRDHVMDDSVLSIGEGQKSGGKDFGNDSYGRFDHGVLKDPYSTDGAARKDAPKDVPKDVHKGAAHKEPHKDAPHAEPHKEPKHVDKPAPADAPAVHTAPKHADAKPAPSGPVLPHHEHHGYDTKNGVDSFGNATESTRAKNKHIPDANHRVFDNSFTTIAKAYLFTGPSTDAHLPQLLPVGTALHVLKVTETRAQIVTPEIAAEQNIWINFMNLGGKPGAGAVVPFGNELSDPADKERADAIRKGLPSVCKPGQSPHQWKFGGNFKPSWGGVALDASLMSKVTALMNWAIANDMVNGDIVIGEGMRDPAHAHYMSVRYWIAIKEMPERMIDQSLFPKLDDGRDVNGTKWWDKTWSREQIIENAKNEYKKHGGAGKVAAAGFNFGDQRRAPLRIDSGQGVSAHCSGHAVDVHIPWRDHKDPEKGVDLWGWEEIYHQFGLTRPLHRDRISDKSMQEHWHLEETGKNLNLAHDEGPQ